MRSFSEKYKAYALIAPLSYTAQTVTGTGVSFEGNNDSGCEAVAVVNLGAVTGAPATQSVIVTIEQSATVGGTYTVTKTFNTSSLATAQIAMQQVTLDTSKPFVRAKAVVAFTSGTTPAIPVAVNLFVKQNNNSVNNQTNLA